MGNRPMREEPGFNLRLPYDLRERTRVVAEEFHAGSLATYIRTLIEDDLRRRQVLGPAHMVVMSLIERLPYETSERVLIEAKGFDYR